MSDHLDTKPDDDVDTSHGPDNGSAPTSTADGGTLKVRDEELADAAGAEEVGERTSLWTDGWRILKRKPMFWLASFLIFAMVLMAVFPTFYLWFYDPFPETPTIPKTACSLSTSINNPNAPNLGRPTGTNWFGFDLQGCDMYVRTILGARISIFIGIIVTAFASVIALVFGTLAGFYGKALDAITSRITDIWFAIPTLLGGIVLLSVLAERGMWQVAFVLTLFGWPSMLRLMRSQVISGKEEDYVMASRSLGANDLRLMARHIVPNGITPVIVYATIFIGTIITAEAALSFLGVGVALPAISWGLMISEAQDRILQVPHLLFFPGMALAITVFGFLVMGDVLRDAFDPKGR